MTWRERLVQRRKLTEADEDRASHWATCAVGEQHAQHPEVVKYTSGLISAPPVDSILTSLGHAFYRHVCEGKRKAAMDDLDAIEDRVLDMKRAVNPTPEGSPS